MIPIELAPEPSDFDEKVRQKGLNAINELIGQPTTKVRRGRRRKKIADSKSEIPPDKFPPFWRDALDDMLRSYHRICAYMCVYIEKGTGAASIDHVIPKSKNWEQIYEWNNYRLASSIMNSRKAAIEDILDPVDIKEGWFTIELTAFQVCPANGLEETITKQILNTIERLQLNHIECRELREEYVLAYWEKEISWNYLQKRAPFIASELKRQKKQNPEDN